MTRVRTLLFDLDVGQTAASRRLHLAFDGLNFESVAREGVFALVDPTQLPLPARLQDRIDDIRALGPAGMAEKRAARTVSAAASPPSLARISMVCRVIPTSSPSAPIRGRFLTLMILVAKRWCRCSCSRP